MSCSSLDLIICESSSQNSGKHWLMFTGLLKDMIKDTDKQPDEEIHRVRSGRVPSAGASVPMELGCVTLPVHGCVHPPGSSRNPVLLGFFTEASSCRHDWLLTPFPSPYPLWRMEGGAENSKLLIMTWSFQWPAPIQEPSRSPLRVTSLEQKTLLSPRKL